MLDFFQMSRTFHKLRVTLYVDTRTKDAAVTITYDRRIVRLDYSTAFHYVATPELADKWFSRDMGERGNLVEFLEWQCRAGILLPEAA